MVLVVVPNGILFNENEDRNVAVDISQGVDNSYVTIRFLLEPPTNIRVPSGLKLTLTTLVKFPAL